MSKGQKSFRSIVITLFVIAVSAYTASAQLTGAKAIPGDYATVAAAVTDLNTQGVGAGGVTFTVADGHVETVPAGGFTISNPAGNGAGNPIVFQRGGGGSRPSFTANAALTVGSLHDAIFEIIGTDNITIDGFEMLENPANVTTAAATNTMTEWGVAILYATTTNGSQNVTVQNCVIDLSRTYQNTFGIYSNSTHAATTVTTVATATTAAGGNSGLKVYGNSITDVNFGILVLGPTAAADNNSSVDIGGVAPATGNTISNFGTTSTFSGYASVSATGWGVLIRNSTAINFSYNSLTSSSGGFTGGTSTTFRGLFIPSFTNAPTGTYTNSINNNTVNLTSGVSGTLQGVTVESTTGTATATQNINNNNITALTASVASTGAATAISYAMANLTTNINNNTFTNLTSNTTGSFTFISASMTIPSGGIKNVTGNSIVTGFNKTGAGGTVTFYTDNGSSLVGTTTNVNNNTISNITVTGSTAVTGISDTDGGAPNKNVQNNTINNITGGLGAIIGITTNFDGGTTTISGNTVSNISNGAAITGILTGTSGTGGALTTNISQNTVHSFAGTGTGAAVLGISLGGTTGHIKNVTRNKIYNLQSNNASGTVNGIAQTSVPTANISNNLIGDLRTTAANASNPLIGINITGGTTVTADFNTVYLNGASTGALFGSSALSASSTPNVTLRNNILVNNSTTTGAGLAAAYRRSTTTLTTYNAASNNNDFFGSTIFTDGTNTDATIAAYKVRVASRDSASINENPTFISTTGSSSDFLHINTVTPTQIESGGITVAGITVDYDGNTRAATPDIGADEFAGTLLDLLGPTISYTNLANTASTGDRVLTTTITDPTGVPTVGVGLPVIYYRKNADPYASTQCSHVSGSTYECSIVAAAVGGLITGDSIFYYVAAQDTAGTPNVSVNPSAGAAGLTANPPAAATPPTTPNTYLIVAAISGTLTVDGVGGGAPNFASLTNAGGVFEYINNNAVAGNITVNITADLTGENGAVALNEFASPYTILIKPSGGPRIVTGSSTAAIIRLNGADRVRIDGSTAASFADNLVGGTPALREMTIENTNTGTSSGVILIGTGTNGAQNNTLRNLNVDGNAPTTTLVGISLGGNTVGTQGADNDGNRVENCRVRRAVFGIYSAGASVANPNTGTVISENQLDATLADRIGRVGIIIFNDNGVQIRENSIGGITSSAGADSVGIGLGVGAADAQFSNTATTSGGVTNALVNRNRINGVQNDNTWGAAGIAVAGDTAGANTISNNMITGVISDSTSPDIVAGIFVAGVTGSQTRLYHNSISMTGDRSALTTPGTSQLPSYGIAITGVDPTVEVKNNIFYTTQTAEAVANPGALSYAIGMVSTTFINLDSDSNDFWSAGPRDGGFRTGSLASAAGTSHVDLSAWQGATSNDLTSQEADPVFIDPANDLHLNAATTPLLGDGQGGETFDHDGDPRPAANTDIGADEVVQAEGGLIAAGSYYNAALATGETIGGNVTVNNRLYLNGVIDPGVNTLTMGCGASVVGGGPSSYINGALTKNYCGAENFTFPVGMGGFYSPANVDVTAVGVNPSSLTVRPHDALLVGFNPLETLTRNWQLDEVGDITANLLFYYDESDVVGNEADYRVWRRESNGTDTNLCSGGPCVDTVNNILGPVNGVTTFSRWTGSGPLAPTSSAASVSGRVVTAGGQGIRGAAIVITGNSLPTPIIVKTGSLGYFQADNLDTGQTYVVTVVSKRFTFSQPSRVINLTDSINDVDFIANPLE